MVVREKEESGRDRGGLERKGARERVRGDEK